MHPEYPHASRWRVCIHVMRNVVRIDKAFLSRDVQISILHRAMVPSSPMNMVRPRQYLSVFIGVCALTYVSVLGQAGAMRACVYVIYMRACFYDRYHFHASSWQ